MLLIIIFSFLPFSSLSPLHLLMTELLAALFPQVWGVMISYDLTENRNYWTSSEVVGNCQFLLIRSVQYY